MTNGLMYVASRFSADETIKRLESVVADHGMKIFTLIDHSGEAEKIGLKMPTTRVLIFGNPKGGTPLMLASPSLAIDLPLKAVVTEDGDSKVWVVYNDPLYLQQRHKIPEELIQNIAGVGVLIAKAVE